MQIFQKVLLIFIYLDIQTPTYPLLKACFFPQGLNQNLSTCGELFDWKKKDFSIPSIGNE